MEDLKKYTPIELQKMINDTQVNHDKIKNEIIDYSNDIDRLQNIINEKIDILNNLEKNYVDLVEEFMNR